MNRLLFVDKKYSLDFNVDSNDLVIECLMPYLGNDKYKVDYDLSTKINRAIIISREKLSNSIIDSYYTGSGFQKNSLMHLARSMGGLLSFFIFDRVLRLNEFYGKNLDDRGTFFVPDVSYIHDNHISYEYMYYNLIEQDPDFNQWVINFITKFSTVSLARIGVNKTEVSYISKEGVNLNVIKSKKNVFEKMIKVNPHTGEKSYSIQYVITKIFNKFLNEINKKLVFKYNNISKSKSNHYIWWDGVGPNSDLFRKDSKFKAPDGPLYSLPELELIKESYDLNERVEFYNVNLKDNFFKIFKDFFNEVGITQNIPDDNLRNAALLYWILQPSYILEGFKENAQIYVNALKDYQFKAYFCGGTYHNIKSSFRMFICSEMNIRIIASQHSAWGGYLANGPLVTEVLIAGCDDYVSFGWKKKPFDGFGWKDKVYNLPAPVLSSIASKNIIKKSKRTNKRVLLCLGFLYRFPAIYNSSLRLDILNKWVELINNIILELSSIEINIEIKMYSEPMLENMSEILNYWLSGKNDFVKEYNDHSQSMRVLMGQDEFNDRYDAIIWDIPAGGFSESIATKRDTFALWSDSILTSLPEGSPYIDELLKQGILFNSGKDLTKSLNLYYQDKNWYDAKDRQRSLSLFMNNFVKIDSKWKDQWLIFFNEIVTCKLR